MPESYGRPSLVLLPVNPFLVYAYWEIPEACVQKVRERLGERFPRAEAVLRFCDVTPGPSAQRHAHGFFDVSIDPHAGSRYVELWYPERSYVAVFGFREVSVGFIPLRRSNRVSLPRAWPCSPEEEAREEVRAEAGPREPPANLRFDALHANRPSDAPQASRQPGAALANQPPVAPHVIGPVESNQANEPPNAPQPGPPLRAFDTTQPLDGLANLRRKYAEIYHGRVWSRPVSPLPHEPGPVAMGPAPDREGSGGGLPEPYATFGSHDVTQRCETEFISGLSSAGSLNRKASDESTGSSSLAGLRRRASEGKSESSPAAPGSGQVPGEIPALSAVATPARTLSDEKGRP